MKIQTRVKGYRESKEINEYAERRLLFSLSRFSNRIESVTIRLEDINGPRGGVDQQCTLSIRFKQGGQLRVESMETDWRNAIDLAADRIGRSVARHIESQRAFRFQSGMVLREGEVAP